MGNGIIVAAIGNSSGAEPVAYRSVEEMVRLNREGEMASRNRERNKEILTAFEAGEAIVALAAKHRLAPNTIYAIVKTEEYKRSAADMMVKELTQRRWL